MLEHFWKYCNQKYEKWANTKIGLVSMARLKNLADLFLMFLDQLQMQPTGFSLVFIYQTFQK